MKRSVVFVALLGCTASEVLPTDPTIELVSTSVEPSGSNCRNGGVAIASGIDANGDGVLESSEVTATTYACTAPNQLIHVVVEPPGLHCAAGGQAIESGADTNDNGVLDDDEVTSTSYVCASAQPLIRLDVEPSGANCARGGTAIRSGVDVNNDGTLEGTEVTSTSYVCEPPSTLQQLVAVQPASSAVCPGGGQTIEVGFDLDANGVLDASEINSITNVCDGVSTLVRVDAEPPGPNCAAGGTAIRTGDDVNHDGILENSEIQSTQFACKPSTTIIGDVVIHVQADVDALAGVEVITGTVRLDTFVLTAVRLPALQSVNFFSCTGPCPLTDVELPSLENAPEIELEGSFTKIDVSQLRTGLIIFGGTFNVTSFVLPFFTSGGVSLETATIQSVSLPRMQSGLVQCGGAALTSLDVPSLVSGQVYLMGDNLSTITLPALTTGEVHVLGSAATVLELPMFTSGTIDVERTPVVSLNLPSYATGSFSALQDPDLVDVTLPHYGSGSLQVSQDPSFQQLDVPVLTQLSFLGIASDPQFPTCAALALWQSIGFPDQQIENDDDDATCP